MLTVAVPFTDSRPAMFSRSVPPASLTLNANVELSFRLSDEPRFNTPTVVPRPPGAIVCGPLPATTGPAIEPTGPLANVPPASVTELPCNPQPDVLATTSVPLEKLLLPVNVSVPLLVPVPMVRLNGAPFPSVIGLLNVPLPVTIRPPPVPPP